MSTTCCSRRTGEIYNFEARRRKLRKSSVTLLLPTDTRGMAVKKLRAPASKLFIIEAGNAFPVVAPA
jgi:hypothetical protein